jgi:radical SAM protein with 4Fe4S-binding SPASM domain
MLLRARGARKTPRLGIFQLNLGAPEALYDCEFLELAAQVDDWVRVDPVHPRSGQRVKVHGKASRFPLPQVSDQLGVAHPDIHPQDRWWTLELPPDSSVPPGPCFWAGNALFVAPSGDVSICLLSHTAEGVLGNLHLDSVEQILTEADAFRARIAALHRRQIAHCSGCRMAEGEPKVMIFEPPAALQ